ncbi:hypothetical protein J4464_04205 [Candidatus Woesearchaeota archaeon]|nr:hypothetical protein [Candidatus Woesearchaeota archaeon]
MDISDPRIKQAQDAILQYDKSSIQEDIAAAVANVNGKLHYKGSIPHFEDIALELCMIAQGGPSCLAALNQNRLWSMGLRSVREYADENPDELQEWMSQAEQTIGIPLQSLGVDASLYDRFERAIQRHGVFGTKSGAQVVADALIDNLESVVSALDASVGKEAPLRSIGDDRTIRSVAAALAESGVSIAEVQRSYHEKGLFDAQGVLAYVWQKALPLLTPDVEAGIQALAAKGIDIQMTAPQLLEIVTSKGLLGPDSLSDQVAGKLLELDVPIETHVYKTLLESGIERRKKESLQEVEELNLGWRKADAKKQVEGRYDGIVSSVVSNGTPVILAKDRLQEIYSSHGLYGSQGILAYLARNMHDVLQPLVDKDLATEEDVRKLSRSYERYSRATSIASLWMESLTDEDAHLRMVQKLAIAAEAQGVAPMEILVNPELRHVKKQVYEAAHGSVTKALQKPMITLIESVNTRLDGKLLQPITAEDAQEIFEGLKEAQPPGILGKMYAATFGRFMKRTGTQRIQDYALLTQALIQQRLARRDRELAEFSIAYVK